MLPDRREINHICIDIDERSPNLAFTMAVSPAWQDPDSESFLSIHIWAVTLVGHGEQAYLNASPLRSFRAHVTGEVADLTLHGQLVGRLMWSSELISSIEVFDWTKTTSSLPCKAVILYGHYLDCIRLLPGNRLLAFSDSDTTFMIYDVIPVVCEEQLLVTAATHATEPSWRLPCPPKNRTRHGGLSAAFIDVNATHFAFFAGSAVHGLVIPHNVQQPPQTFELARFSGPRFPDLALGFEKMFAHHHRDSALRLGFAWKDDRKGTNPDYTVKAREYSRDWNVVWPPILDEGSGRIVQSLINGVLVMDTALSSVKLVEP
ncbi:hypothetical protein FPV67DRAFT_1673296 [Lyophyllum atratum]|nr:hypothetical protein FPV67DRAFT_1673296 [Lyophyllum atratum]